MLSQHQQFYEIIEASRHPLILLRKDFSGDSLASALALDLALKKLNKKAEIVCDNFILPKRLAFLPSADTVKSDLNARRKLTLAINSALAPNPAIEHKLDNEQLHITITHEGDLTSNDIKIIDNGYLYDLIITLNAPDLESLGSLYDNHPNLFYQTPIISIDHSPENEHYGQVNFINITATSVSEVLYEIFERLDNKLLDTDIATHLLTGMIEKTKSFKTANVTPRSLSIASQLIALGANRESIIQNLYQTKTVDTLRLWGKILLNLKITENKKIAWAEITQEDFVQTGTTEENLTSLIEELIACIPSVEITLLSYFKENKNFFLIKSEKNHNLKDYFRQYSPSGTKSNITISSDLMVNDLLPMLTNLS